MYISLTPWGGIKDLHKKSTIKALSKILKNRRRPTRHDWDVMADVGTKAMGTDTLGTFAGTSLCLCPSG